MEVKQITIYSINVFTDLHPVCEQLHLRPNLLQDILHVRMSISDQWWFLWSGSRPVYNSLCADMVMWISTLVRKITLHKSELEVCPLSIPHWAIKILLIKENAHTFRPL